MELLSKEWTSAFTNSSSKLETSQASLTLGKYGGYNYFFIKCSHETFENQGWFFISPFEGSIPNLSSGFF